ncbi:MAG: PilZ domain-containing protein [Rhodospirillales bacterium]
MRQFMRHPANITIEVTAGSELDHATRHSRNVGLGGLAFHSDRPLAREIIIELRIPLVRPPFETKARVVWCRVSDAGYDMGVEFLDPNDAFRARMVEQICHIEDYRNGVYRSEGRELTTEQAAMEWIGKYASQFPDDQSSGAEEAA